MEKAQRSGFFANALPQTTNPFQNWVVVADQVFDAADPSNHMSSHLVAQPSPVLAWEIHKWVRSPVIGTDGNARQFR